jgi:hypothetical protein
VVRGRIARISKGTKVNRFQLKVASAALLPSVATMLFVQACGGGSDALAQSAPDPIVGVWESVVTQKDCASGNVIATFRGAQVFHAGGTLTDTNAAGPATRGPGFGYWVRGAETYTAKFRFFRFNADGSLAGSNVVTRTVTLSSDGQSATGATRAAILDASGNTLQQICASDTSVKFN